MLRSPGMLDSIWIRRLGSIWSARTEMRVKIHAVELVLPEQIVTNDDVIDRIAYHSKDIFIGNQGGLIRMISRLLLKSGSETRFWSMGRSQPIEYIAKAVDHVMNRCGLIKRDIDLIIYVGVDRGFYEPANAYFVADYLGFHLAQCFDIVDACNSWSRALQICDGLFRTGQFRTALLVNGEFSMFEGGPVNPKLFQITRIEQLQHRLPAFTLGEGATATVVTAEPDECWDFQTWSSPACADLCTVSCHDGARFARSSGRLDVDGPGHFVSFGEDMVSEGVEHAVRVLRALSTPLDELKAIFPHTVSEAAIEAAATRAAVGHIIYSVFPRVGNLVSAAVPAGIALALADGHVRSGDIAAGWVGSAGMVFSAYTFSMPTTQ
jgi:3-oxoacyl-[acyl-carrier-protein] synthase III